MRILTLALTLMVATAAFSKEKPSYPILKMDNFGNLKIARYVLAEADKVKDFDYDLLEFPRCHNSNNQRVNAIKFTAPMYWANGKSNWKLKVYNIVVVKYDGKRTYREVITPTAVDTVLNPGERSKWYPLKVKGPGSRACIKRIVVRGEQFDGWAAKARPSELIIKGRIRKQ